jgi:glyoxylase I family protein
VVSPMRQRERTAIITGMTSSSQPQCTTDDHRELVPERLRVTRARHVALTVRNLEESARWYSDLFDLHEVFREEAPHRRAVVLASPDGWAMHIGLVQHSGTGDEKFDPTVIGLDCAAWSVASREDLDRWQAFLEERGVVHSPVADLGVAAMLNLKDPDGIALALFWDEVAE